MTTIKEQAREDALNTLRVRIRDERNAIALLESMGRGDGTDARFAREELTRYETALRRMNAECPQCGATMERDPQCVIDEPVLAGYYTVSSEVPRRTRIASAWLCTGCEYCVEDR